MNIFKSFEKIKTPSEITISEFENLRSKDLSDKDLSKVPVDILEKADFDTTTKWPSKENLPTGFSPEQLLEDAKNPGLGIKKLHEQGITGQGIVVAIIDQKLDINHEEYRDAVIDYTEYGKATEESISMHGPAVASLLVGKNCGVAPGAKLVYKATPSTGRDFHFGAQALNDIIEKNQNAQSNEKIRIVSCSIGYRTEVPEPGLDEWIQTLNKAEKSGIFVVDVNGEQIDIQLNGCGSSENKDNFDSYYPWLNKELTELDKNKELNKLIFEKNTNKILEKLRELAPEKFRNISDFALKEKIEKRINELEKILCIPCDYRTMASSWRKEGQYVYNGKGGLSWAVPYLAGLFALALQIDPSIDQEKLVSIMKESAIINNQGIKIVNPEGIIDLVRERM